MTVCPRARRLAGFSAVELMASIVILSAVSISLMTVFSSSSNAVAEMSANTQADSELLRAIDRLHSELDFAAADQIVLVDSKTLNFASVTGWNGTQTVLGPTRELRFAGSQLLLDGTVLVENVSNGNMAVASNMLAVQIEIEAAYTRGGNTEMVRRNTTMIHRFEN